LADEHPPTDMDLLKRFFNLSDFVVDVMEDVASLVRALYQVAMSIWLHIFLVNQS